MTKDELIKLDGDLAIEQQEIESQLKSMAIENPLVGDDFEQPKLENMGTSPDDTAQEAGEFDRNWAIMDALERRLKEIINTRGKIKQGIYGVCSNCSKKIEEPRLKAMPVATFCIDCAQKIELV